MFEIVVAVTSGVLTAHLGGSGAAVVLARHIPKLRTVFAHLLPKLRAMSTRLDGALKPFITKLDELMPAFANAKAGGWCFVAGTMIATAHGSVPMEQIRVGDWVWSAHEQTGEIGLRPVMELYRNTVDRLWEIHFDHDQDPITKDAKLTFTPEHPFWSEAAQGFQPADQLQSGDFVRLLNGELARVSQSHPHRGPPERGYAVYNFAVADHHTYFAGDGGVWVHNVCGAALDRAIAFNKIHLDEFAGDWNKAIRKTIQSYDEVAGANNAKKLAKLSQKERAEVAAALVENAGTHIPFNEAEEILGIIRNSLKIDGTKSPLSMTVADGVAAMGVKPGFARNVDNFSDAIKEVKMKLLDAGIDESSKAWRIENHSESIALQRPITQLAEQGKGVPKTVRLVTEGWPVCNVCVNGSYRSVSDGLPAIAKALGIEELILTSKTFDGIEGTVAVMKNGFLQ